MPSPGGGGGLEAAEPEFQVEREGQRERGGRAGGRAVGRSVETVQEMQCLHWKEGAG